MLIETNPKFTLPQGTANQSSQDLKRRNGIASEGIMRILVYSHPKQGFDIMRVSISFLYCNTSLSFLP